MDRIRDKKPKIAVVGDLMIDHYIWGTCERISPEAPVQVVNTQKESYTLGGAGNVVSNLLEMEANIDIYSVVGDDSDAILLKELLNKHKNSKANLVTQKGRKTTKKSRIIASNQQVIRYDSETKESISLASQMAILNSLQKELFSYDIILLSDYGKGVLTKSLTADIISIAKAMGKMILVDPKGSDYSKYSGATLLTPNKKEASLATGININSEDSLHRAITELKELYKLDYSVVTLSEEGVALLDKELEIIPTVAKEVFDVTGAGDTVLASLGVALASGFNIKEACSFANKAAAVVVAKVGSATATLNEIEEYEHSLHKGQAQSKIKNFEQIERISKRVKTQRKKVIFTNGCFDILHRGHATYLQEAKELGDILIVGLNSDESIKVLKGESRPINMLEDRAFLLASLESVDFVVPFTQETPYELIKKVLPDILVKGADYEGKEVVGSNIAKDVKLIKFVDGKSTSKIIEKISKGSC
jgi:D-beta-D-heptose 7-phosphate kinase/D-beta-D-heptose 1-phosphate adenosyltransferase